MRCASQVQKHDAMYSNSLTHGILLIKLIEMGMSELCVRGSSLMAHFYVLPKLAKTTTLNR